LVEIVTCDKNDCHKFEKWDTPVFKINFSHSTQRFMIDYPEEW